MGVCTQRDWECNLNSQAKMVEAGARGFKK